MPTNKDRSVVNELSHQTSSESTNSNRRAMMKRQSALSSKRIKDEPAADKKTHKKDNSSLEEIVADKESNPRREKQTIKIGLTVLLLIIGLVTGCVVGWLTSQQKGDITKDALGLEQDKMSQKVLEKVSNMGKSRCRVRQWKCNNGKCINSKDICQGTVECDDNSDEEDYVCRDTTALMYLADEWTLDNVPEGWKLLQNRHWPFKMTMKRGWGDYKLGFQQDNEMWIGLEKMHKMTSNKILMLRIEVAFLDKRSRIPVVWKTVFPTRLIKVGPEEKDYELLSYKQIGQEQAYAYRYVESNERKSIQRKLCKTAHEKWPYYAKTIRGKRFITVDSAKETAQKGCITDYNSSGWWFAVDERNEVCVNSTQLVLNSDNPANWKARIFDCRQGTLTANYIATRMFGKEL